MEQRDEFERYFGYMYLDFQKLGDRYISVQTRWAWIGWQAALLEQRRSEPQSEQCPK